MNTSIAFMGRPFKIIQNMFLDIVKIGSGDNSASFIGGGKKNHCLSK